MNTRRSEKRFRVSGCGGGWANKRYATEFISKLPVSDCLIADKGYDNEKRREHVRKRISIPLVPRKAV